MAKVGDVSRNRRPVASSQQRGKTALQGVLTFYRRADSHPSLAGAHLMAHE